MQDDTFYPGTIVVCVDGKERKEIKENKLYVINNRSENGLVIRDKQTGIPIPGIFPESRFLQYIPSGLGDMPDGAVVVMAADLYHAVAVARKSAHRDTASVRRAAARKVKSLIMSGREEMRQANSFGAQPDYVPGNAIICKPKKEV